MLTTVEPARNVVFTASYEDRTIHGYSSMGETDNASGSKQRAIFVNDDIV